MPKSKRKRPGKTGFIGVTVSRKKFSVRIWIGSTAHRGGPGKWKNLGSSHVTAEQAARVYDKEAIKLRRPFSKLNYPKEAPVGYTPIQQPLLSRNTVGYRGVQKNGNKFRVDIRIDGKQQYIGRYETAKEAAIAYDLAVLKANQSTTLLNFPEMVHNLDVEPKRTKQNVNSTGLGFFRRNQIYDQASIAAAIFDCCIALRPSSNQEWQQISHSKFSR